MDERPPADEQAGARRWAAWLAIAAGVGVLVELAALQLYAAPSDITWDEPLAVRLVAWPLMLATRSGIPLLGAFLVLRSRRHQAGLLILVAFALLQLSAVVTMAWHATMGMPPLFLPVPALALAAGIAAASALRSTGGLLGGLRGDGGRALAAAGMLAVALVPLMPVRPAAAVLSSGVPSGGLVPFLWPFGLFVLLGVATWVVLAVLVAGLRHPEAALGVAGVAALSAVSGLVTALAGLFLPSPPEVIAPGASPVALALQVIAAILLLAGCAALWRQARA